MGAAEAEVSLLLVPLGQAPKTLDPLSSSIFFVRPFQDNHHQDYFVSDKTSSKPQNVKGVYERAGPQSTREPDNISLVKGSLLRN